MGRSLSARITALVPMRHHSERVPGKNYRQFAGRPLYHYVIDNLNACGLVDQIVVDTDSPVIMEDASKSFPDVLLLQRPEHLIADTTPMNDVLLHDVAQVTSEYYIQTHSTNPLLSSATIKHALTQFLDNYPAYDSMFAVTKLQARLWDELARPINHNPAILLRTQDLPPTYLENSCFYIFTKEILEIHHNRIGQRPMLYEVPSAEAWDIDEELDFRMAELLYQHLHSNARQSS